MVYVKSPVAIGRTPQLKISAKGRFRSSISNNPITSRYFNRSSVELLSGSAVGPVTMRCEGRLLTMCCILCVPV